MKKLFLKKIFAFVLVLGIFISTFAIKNLADAAGVGSGDDLWGGKKTEIGTAVGADSTTDPRVIVGNVIAVLLGFLGIYMVVMIMMGGYQWMTAGGDSGKVEKAVGKIKDGVIGMIIILSAYAIANFIISKVWSVTNE